MLIFTTTKDTKYKWKEALLLSCIQCNMNQYHSKMNYIGTFKKYGEEYKFYSFIIVILTCQEWMEKEI